jgi:hypothetical protein
MYVCTGTVCASKCMGTLPWKECIECISDDCVQRKKEGMCRMTCGGGGILRHHWFLSSAECRRSLSSLLLEDTSTLILWIGGRLFPCLFIDRRQILCGWILFFLVLWFGIREVDIRNQRKGVISILCPEAADGRDGKIFRRNESVSGFLFQWNQLFWYLVVESDAWIRKEWSCQVHVTHKLNDTE